MINPIKIKTSTLASNHNIIKRYAMIDGKCIYAEINIGKHISLKVAEKMALDQITKKYGAVDKIMF